MGSRTEGRRDNKGHKERQGGTREQHRRMKKERDGEWGREIKKKTTVMGSRIEDWKEKIRQGRILRSREKGRNKRSER